MEGQFISNKLEGFGREISGDKQQSNIGFFKENRSFGYQKRILKGKVTEGLYENDVHLTDDEKAKEYDSTNDFIAQKVIWKQYIIEVIPTITEWNNLIWSNPIYITITKY